LSSYRLTFSDLAFAVLFWALLILRFGYTYGTNDHVELMPYVLFLHDHSLYAHDLFIQSLHTSQPNERTVMAHLLLPFAEHMSIGMFLLHFFNTVLLVLALVKLAGRFIENQYVSWAAVFTSVLILNDKGLGNVDLYSSCVQASDVGCMVIAWALNVFFDRKYLLAALVMSLATFVHVLEGFDVMAVLCGVMLLKWIFDKEISFKEFAAFVGLYVLTAGIYLLFIFRAKTLGAGTLSSDELFQIMFVFRHPHHFMFSTFATANKLLFAFYVLATLLFYPGRSRTVLQFLAIGCAGLVVYIVGVDVFHAVFIANFQWYKVVQWIKFLGIVGVFGWVYHYLRPLVPNKSNVPDSLTYAGSAIGGAFIFYMYFSGAFDLGYKQHVESEVALCKKVKELTPKDAVFIQPFEMTGLKFHGQRSSYVEFKAIAKNQRDLKKWYERINEVFGLDYHTDSGGFYMSQKADDHLDNLDAQAIRKLKNEGVTHMICKTDKYKEGHKLILVENGYFVYEL
jgi:hypothetical protein